MTLQAHPAVRHGTYRKYAQTSETRDRHNPPATVTFGLPRYLAAIATTCVLSIAAGCDSNRVTQPSDQRPSTAASSDVAVAAGTAASDTAAVDLDSTVADPRAAAHGTWSVVSYRTPNYMKASTGNLYWTHNAAGSSATVHRYSQEGSPGNERILYRELARPNRVPTFEGITFALVNGLWKGYFIACAQDAARATPRTCTIKRVPLSGLTPEGAAFVVTSAVGPTAEQLETDGLYLYWRQSDGIRRVPINGGAVTSLTNFANVRSISLTSTHVYFTTPSAVRRVGKAGGVASTVSFEGTGISQVFAREASGTTTVYWGAQNGAVRRQIGAQSPTTLWPGYAGRIITSLGYDGSRVLFTDCASPNGVDPHLGTCTLRERTFNGVVGTVRSGLHNAGMLQWTATEVFLRGDWLNKHVH